jgi:3-deoxy-D-manno-octulosonate 8-phosphate phosphatase (KDO 8-P phosphatase)
MKMLQATGVEIGIITGRTSQVVQHRMDGLGIRHVYQGKQEKLPAFEELVAKLGLPPHQVAYVGDDVVDLPVMRRVGLAIAVQDAAPLVKQHAHWTTDHGGGRGAARDVCELIMRAQGTLDAQLQHYLT